MTLFETLAVVVGGSIAKAVVKRWVSDASLAEEATGKVSDLLTRAGLEYRERERARRQLEEISERIAEQLSPYFSSEFTGGLPQHEMEAAAYAVSATIDRGFNDPRVALQVELDPDQLVARLKAAYPKATRDLSPAGAQAEARRDGSRCCVAFESSCGATHGAATPVAQSTAQPSCSRAVTGDV